MLRPDRRLVEVATGTVPVATTRHAARALETASPPACCCPREDVAMLLLSQVPHAPGACGRARKGEAGCSALFEGRYRNVDAAWI